MDDYEILNNVGMLLVIVASCTLVGIVVQTISVYFSTKVALGVLAICVLIAGLLICKYAKKKTEE